MVYERAYGVKRGPTKSILPLWISAKVQKLADIARVLSRCCLMQGLLTRKKDQTSRRENRSSKKFHLTLLGSRLMYITQKLNWVLDALPMRGSRMSSELVKAEPSRLTSATAHSSEADNSGTRSTRPKIEAIRGKLTR